MFSFDLKPKDALKYLKNKGYKFSFNYEELMFEAHHRAFTVAKIMRLDLLMDVHESLINALEEGKPFEEWKREIKPTLEKYGWLGETTVTDPRTGETKTIYVGSKRLETIFNTNMRVSYNVGRYDQMKALPISVYWRYVAILDNRTRPSHQALHGMIRHRDDPFWQKNYPPNGWNCRCKVTAYSEKDIKDRGWTITPPDTSLPPGYTGPDPDWDYNVGEGNKQKLNDLLSDKESEFKQITEKTKERFEEND